MGSASRAYDGVSHTFGYEGYRRTVTRIPGPTNWCKSETMICKGAKVYDAKRGYNIAPYATVDVEVEVKRKEYTGKTEVSAKLAKINVGVKPASGVPLITEMVIKLSPKGELAPHCHHRPTMEPHFIPTYHETQRISAHNIQIPLLDLRAASVGCQVGTILGNRSSTFRWSSAPSTEYDSISAEFRWKAETFENGTKIAPGFFHLGSLPELPIPEGYFQLVEPKSCLGKASWDCEFPTSERLQKVVLGMEVELHSTIFRNRRLGPFYSVVKGPIFAYEQDLTFTKPLFSYRDVL